MGIYMNKKRKYLMTAVLIAVMGLSFFLLFRSFAELREKMDGNTEEQQVMETVVEES